MAGSVLITGANGSLAINAVEYLLRAFPELTLLLTVRDESDDDPNTTQLRHLIAKHPEASISVLKLDLNSLKEVAGFCDQVAAEIISSRVPRLVAIICNEVHWRLSGGPNKSDDGFEQSMAINHLAHFALSVRLLCSRSLDLVNGRIVFLGSQAHWLEKAGLSKGFPTKLPEDLEDLVHPPPDSWSAELGRGFQRYAQSKLVITMVMYELNRTLKKVSASCGAWYP
jgi:NAD(P)-dependent dehydrogenase (short-subunit alcohol dehydrogenase family)